MLILLGLQILLTEKGDFSLLDGAFWGVILLLVAARYLDVAVFKGNTAQGEPATMAHWRRFSLLVVLLGLAAWTAAHLLGRI